MLKVVKHYIIYFNVLFVTAFLFNISIFPQTKDKTINWPEPVFEHLTIADGLQENSVRFILQDHLGFMWLATQNGLVRYDGYSMTVYRPNPDDSLSISSIRIRAMYEDKSGTLWIGTQYGGLNRFNRATETFTRYVINPDDSASTNSYYVENIYEDKAGNFWVGTEKDLYLFDRQAGSFKRIRKMIDDKNKTIVDFKLRAIIEDRSTGNLYVSMGNKILIYDAEKELLVGNKEVVGSGHSLGEILSLYQATDGAIWIGHSQGLAKFNSLLNTIEYYQPINSDYDNRENSINHITEDEYGNIWGTSGLTSDSNDLETANGLICFNPHFELFRRYKYDAENKTGLSGNRIWSLYIDHTGIFWVGTHGSGLNKWDRHKQKFKRYSYDPINPDREHFNIVYSIIEDQDRIIWFGTDNGLYSWDRFSNEFKNFRYTTKDKNNSVTYIYKDENGILWFGTVTKGLCKFDPVVGSFHLYSNNPNNSATISKNLVRFILPDENDILWIGTWGGGLNKFDKNKAKFTQYKNDPNNIRRLSNDKVECIYKDRNGELWIGTNHGLNLFDRTDESFKSFETEGDINTTFLTIYEDHKGNFWLGTYNTGLLLFDRDREIPVYNVAKKDGLSYNEVRSILEDDRGRLWISTTQGLSRFDPETNNIKNYFPSDVFEENRYFGNSACKSSTGEMLFGTYDGFIIFHPDSIKDDPVPPKVVISNVSLFNRPGEKLYYDGFISELKELNLSYNENDLRFDYIGLHYGDPSKNQYKYILERHDKDWVNAGTQRNAVYTNLDAGEYVFRVKACNADGVWNEKGASLKIIIPPPFWATWWAYGFYLIVFGSILYGIRKYEMNRQLWKHRMELETVEATKYKEINKMKSRFFANISHEFRTPLTLILGPSDNILTEAPSENIIKQAGTIKRNANRLLLLISQLLDLSKLEAGKLELKASKANIVPFIKGFTMSFESLAEGKDITLKVSAEKEQIELYFDKEKMIKIMSNLLSNAFKFTPKGGAITVALSLIHSPSGSGMSSVPVGVLTKAGGQGEGIVEIKVRDTGIGISQEELPKLFDRFYQVDDSNTREHEGTGIGLALVKELVELHQGKISVDSEPGDSQKAGTGWTEFTIELPLGRKHLRNYEIIEDEVSTDEVIMSYAESGARKLNEFDILDSSHEQEGQALQTPQNDNEADEDKTLILVVEDNADVREFIKDSLGKGFQIQEASNGEQGVKKAEQIIPDLIISDIMMPKMDGNELTRILKNDEKTSHIPIILLTAKSEQESKHEGLETGADDYLTKPFDTKELQIRINNLINIRRKLQQKYSSVDYVPVMSKKETEKKLTNLEEQFMCKVMEVIENHLSEEEFSIEQFGKEVGMSRVQLHRKLKALSGKSASNYLRSVRLSKAKKMIEEEKGNISEIAYSVGFSSPQYFSRCFKEEFGFPPSELTI